MKRRNLFMLVIMVITVIAMSGCAKDGATGPAGQNGTNGTNGTNANVISAADSAAYNAADGSIGARLYDHLISEANITTPAVRNYPNFFRCKQCHGWDLRGSMGAYINRAANASRPAVAPNDIYMYAKLHDIKQIFDAVKHTGGTTVGTKSTDSYSAAMPDYGKLLSDAQVWDIVKFLKKDAHNFDDFYDMNTSGMYPTGTVSFKNIGRGGDPVAGLATYNSLCKSCHGANGTQINVYCQGEYMGGFFRSNPHELIHKGKWGMPMDIDHPSCSYAGAMSVFATITDQDLRNMLVMGQDTVAFPSTAKDSPFIDE